MNDQLNLLNSLHCTQVYSVRWSRLYSFCTVFVNITIRDFRDYLKPC